MSIMENLTEKSTQTTEDKLMKWKRWLGFTNCTFKDGLQLVCVLLVPTIIGVLTILTMRNATHINQDNRENDLEIARLQRLSDDQNALDLANETVLNQFVTNMADIVLRTHADGASKTHYRVIRSSIVTVFRRLDFQRKKVAIQHLHNMGILTRGPGPFDVDIIHPVEMHLNEAPLNGMDFSGGLRLPKLLLRNASLINASFANSDFQYADFTGSILTGANFSGAILDGSKFLDAQLQQTDFTRASVLNIQLDQTNLSGSSIVDAQIAQALLVYKTILPNGTYARNKTFVVNGDGRQETFGWNVTLGKIEVKNSTFSSSQSASMVQFIDLSEILNTNLPDDVYSCISFQFRRSENLQVTLAEFKSYSAVQYVNHIPQVLPPSFAVNSSNPVDFQYWSTCPWGLISSRYIILTIIFNFPNNTTNGGDFPAVKDIQLTAFGHDK